MDDVRYFSHFKSKRWSELNKRTINGKAPSCSPKIVRDYLSKGIRLELTREQFDSWCNENRDIILGLYKSGEVPSIDRINSKGHYSSSNMRIISLKENTRAGREARWDSYKKEIAQIDAALANGELKEVAKQVINDFLVLNQQKIINLIARTLNNQYRRRGGKRMSELEEFNG